MMQHATAKVWLRWFSRSVQQRNYLLTEILGPFIYEKQSTDNLVGGSYNGLINFFDLRKPGATIGQAVPLETSVIEKSHHDPVYDVFWISSKTGAQPTGAEVVKTKRKSAQITKTRS